MATPRRTSDHATPKEVEAWKKTERSDGTGLCQVCRGVWTPIAGICSGCEFDRSNKRRHGGRS